MDLKKKLFSISPLKLAFRTNKESNAAVTLHFEDLAVKVTCFFPKWFGPKQIEAIRF